MTKPILENRFMFLKENNGKTPYLNFLCGENRVVFAWMADLIKVPRMTELLMCCYPDLKRSAEGLWMRQIRRENGNVWIATGVCP